MAKAVTPDSNRVLLPGIARYGAAQLLVALSSLVALWIASRWENAAIEMIYLPAVLAAGVWLGFGPALLAAVTSALSYNYFFTKPVGSFRIESPLDLVDEAILFLVAVVTSQLASAVRRQAKIAEAHAARNATIAGFAGELLSCTNEAEVAQSACDEVSSLFDCNTAILSGTSHPKTIAAAPRSIAITPADIAAAVHTLLNGQVAGHGSEHVWPAEWLFLPIRADGTALAAMGVSRDDGLNPVNEQQRLLLNSLLDQTALALARTRGSATPTPKKIEEPTAV